MADVSPEGGKFHIVQPCANCGVSLLGVGSPMHSSRGDVCSLACWSKIYEEFQADTIDEVSHDAVNHPSTNPEIKYQNFELKSNERCVDDILNRYVSLLPSWLNVLTIAIYDEHGDGPDGAMAWSKASPEYGFATISILSKWLDRPVKEQCSCILHEILHIAQRREYNFVWDRLLNPVQDRNEDLHKFLVEDYRQRNEEFIEGLSHALVEAMGCPINSQ